VNERTFAYQASREKIREFARATGETNPLYFDVDVARAAGYRDVVAPPMFVAVYAAPVFREALWDPSLAVDRRMTVHGAQEFRWGELVIAGDELLTTVALRSDEPHGRNRFIVFETLTNNQDSVLVAAGRWTAAVRPGRAVTARSTGA
jgi:acyl dehydratase